MISRLTKAVMAAILVIGVAGCASSFKSDVSSWHQLPPPNGETFAIVAKDVGKQASIEFAHYAELVSLGLQNVGYRPARSDQTADLIVRMDYGVSDGRTEIRSYGGYMGIGYGHGPYGHGYGHGYGGYGYGGYGGNDIRSYPVYSRYLEVEIAATGNTATNLYETKVVSEGKISHLEQIMPLLVDSLFVDFPGPSGVTRRVVLDPTEQAAQSSAY